MKKGDRGTMDSRVSNDGDETIVRWQNNKMVNVASIFIGIGAIDKVKHWNKSEKAYVEVDRPEAIWYYNDYMGGVDLMDCLISYYPMTFRTKRWPTRAILHLFTLNVANAWIEYRERERKKRMKRIQILDLLSFRDEVAQILCKADQCPTRVRGRPSFQSLLYYCPIPEKKTPAAVLPLPDALRNFMRN